MESIAELKKKCARADKDPSTEKIHRFIGVRLAKLFILMKVQANTITIMSIVFGIISSVLFFFGNLWGIFIGTLILEFRHMLDKTDGTVARYWGKSSMTGLFLDQFDHQLAGKLMFFPLGFGIYMHTKWIPILVFGFLGSIFSMSVVNTSLYWAIIRKRQRLTKGYDTLEKFERILKKKEKVGIGIGEVKGSYNNLYLIANKFSKLWTTPYYYWVLGIVIITELINLSYNFTQSYFLLTLYVVIYGSILTLMQFFSFIINYKARSVDIQYQALFGIDLKPKKEK